jgi:hypothetical protein
MKPEGNCMFNYAPTMTLTVSCAKLNVYYYASDALEDEFDWLRSSS